MKKNLFIALGLAAGLALSVAATAYYPHLSVRACPHCRAHAVVEVTVSGNTIGAAYYTDGKREAPMLPDHPLLAKCPFCGTLIWVDEAEEVASGFEAAKGKPKVLRPSEEELLASLNGPALERDKEAYVRQRAWWAGNDVRRQSPDSPTGFSTAQVRNLEAFSDMLDERDEGQRILKAEIARELGRFEACLRLLERPVGAELKYAADFILRLARAGDRIVRPFAE
jgi:hypothetical protein